MAVVCGPAKMALLLAFISFYLLLSGSVSSEFHAYMHVRNVEKRK